MFAISRKVRSLLGLPISLSREDMSQLLINRGFIPLVNHSNPILKEIEEESDLRISLLTKNKGKFFFLKSSKINSYFIPFDDFNVVTITDGMAQVIEDKIKKTLLNPTIIDLFQKVFELTITEKFNGNRFLSGTDDKLKDVEICVYLFLAKKVFNNACMFVVLHEISHILGDYSKDGTETIHDQLRKFELQEQYEEARADQEASWWLCNRTHDHLAENLPEGAVTANLAVFEFVVSFLGALISVIFMNESSEFGRSDSNTYPSYETRLEGLKGSLDSFLLKCYGEHQWRFSIPTLITDIRTIIEIDHFGKKSKHVIRI